MEQGAAEETMPSVTAEHTVTATATMHPSNTGPTHCSKALPICKCDYKSSPFVSFLLFVEQKLDMGVEAVIGL
jgi:hypothetical protein